MMNKFVPNTVPLYIDLKENRSLPSNPLTWLHYIRVLQEGGFVALLSLLPYGRAIQNYGERYQSGSGGFETNAFFRAFGDFIGIFTLSLLIGALMGCITALISFLLNQN
ncbi:unnamed protein product, partial [Timema podura]|nr:unnamed protein product [Timema podura]